MKSFFRIFQSGVNITVKFLFLNVTIFIVLGIVIGVMFMVFRDIEKLTTEIIEKNTHVVRNSQLNRELSDIFSRTHLLISTFYENGAVLETEGNFLLEETERLAGYNPDEELRARLSDFHAELKLFLRQCSVMNDLSQKIRLMDRKLFPDLEKLRENISAQRSGEMENANSDQFGKMVYSCRETLMKASFLFADQEVLQADSGDVESIVLLLDDLYVRLGTFLAFLPDIDPVGDRLLDMISEYKDIIVTFNNARISFHEKLAKVNTTNKKIVMIIKKTDENIADTFIRMHEESRQFMQNSVRLVYILCGGLVLLIGILTYLFFLFNIRRPMEVICRGLESIGDGDMDTRIRLKRQDEWNIIEMALNRMAGEIWNSYSELYRKNEELQRMHIELRKTQRHIRNIIDSMPSVMIGVDSEGRVTLWNSAAEKAAGIAGDDIAGRLLTEVYPELGVQIGHIEKSLTDRQPVKAEKQVRYSQDEVCYEDIMIYPLITDGIEGAVIRVDDVTDRVRIEEMMIQTEKMMSVGGLAAGMAHEINNPLGVILQGVQNAFRRLSPDIEANFAIAETCGTDLDTLRLYLEKRGIFRYLHGIQNAGTRAARIVTNMLNFSRYSESDRLPADIHNLLDNTVELAANDYDLKKKYDFRYIDIVREYDPELPLIPCIVTEIEQVVLNLLKNSAQAAGREGKTIIIALRTKREDKYARIEIQDNGPGMDEKTRARVFEPFFTTKSVGVGTGLGLSVSFFIITNNHKGTISVESEPGKGAKFIIRLPLKDDLAKNHFFGNRSVQIAKSEPSAGKS